MKRIFSFLIIVLIICFSCCSMAEESLTEELKDKHAEECFKGYRTILKNPYSATLQEYQYYPSPTNKNYEYYLLAVTAENGFGAIVAGSGFAVYNTETSENVVVVFDDYYFDGSVLPHVNGFSKEKHVLTNEYRSHNNVVRNNCDMSYSQIASCMDEFQEQWQTWKK